MTRHCVVSLSGHACFLLSLMVVVAVTAVVAVVVMVVVEVHVGVDSLLQYNCSPTEYLCFYS